MFSVIAIVKTWKEVSVIANFTFYIRYFYLKIILILYFYK